MFAHFNINGEEYKGKWFTKGTDRIEVVKKAKALSDYCKGKPALIKEVKRDRKIYEPPLLFNLSALQTTANKKYKISTEKTLLAAQKLYDNGFISYPRTDCSYVTEDEAKTFPQLLEGLREEEEYRDLILSPIKSLVQNKRFVNKVSDHHAILITENIPNHTDLSDDEHKIYDLVAKSLTAAHYDNAIFDYSNVITAVDNKFTFSTKGKVMVQEGWRKVLYPKGDWDEGDSEYQDIPPVKDGGQGETEAVETVQKFTKSKKRYSEGDLIALMKSPSVENIEDEELEKILKSTHGLGTEATRASIIKTLKVRKYIEIKKNMVYPKEKGRLLIKAIGDSVLTSAKLTAQWEKRLSEIGGGRADHQKFIEQAKQLTTKLVKEAINNLQGNEIELEEKQIQPTSTNDEKKEKEHTKSESKKEKSVDNRKVSKVETDDSSTPASAVKNSKPEAKNTKSHNDIPVGPCKYCGGDVVDKKNFYGCSNYRETGCGFTISKTILGKEITRENIEMLLKTGDTRLIDGFKQRSGNGTFKAILSWNVEEKRLIFNTPNPNIFKLPMELLKPLTVYEPPEEDTLREFQSIEDEARAIKYPCKVEGVKHGPRITRYELKPEPGINITGYKRFKANFQAALRAKRVSMYIPIPGTNQVGIEIPSKHPYPVQLRGLLENEEFQAFSKNRPLPFPLGSDIYGRPYFADLADMPHLLVAGATGSGKSVFLNAVILSLVYGRTPEELKFMFIDPKQVELSVYEELPHLFQPIVTDTKKAEKALAVIVREMERRYEQLQKVGVRNLGSYNTKMEKQGKEKIPYICVVIDEVADLIMTTDGSVEDHIVRISQLARACGIHLIVATQRPTKKVLSPLIKANMPVRVGFAVASSMDSMTILDQPGAENLLGKGDMIYLSKDRPKTRLQSGFVSDEETEKVVRYLSENFTKNHTS